MGWPYRQRDAVKTIETGSKISKTGQKWDGDDGGGDLVQRRIPGKF